MDEAEVLAYYLCLDFSGGITHAGFLCQKNCIHEYNLQHFIKRLDKLQSNEASGQFFLKNVILFFIFHAEIMLKPRTFSLTQDIKLRKSTEIACNSTIY